MTFTMRREIRKKVLREAWLDIGSGKPLLDCTLVDISPSGAKLEIESAVFVPQTFRLRLTHGDVAGVVCCVVWRTAGALGVLFANSAPGRTEAKPWREAAAREETN